LFEALSLDDKKKGKDNKYRYPLTQLNPQSVFPYIYDETNAVTDAQSKVEYKALFDGFVESLEKLLHKEENIALWFEHLESLMLIYTAMIPAARAGKAVPDVSLYDHSKSVAALSVALYMYHRDTNSMSVEAICESAKQSSVL